MKILITWIGFNEDFDQKGRITQIRPTGFTSSIHSDIYEQYKIDKHVIISTHDSSNTISHELKSKIFQLSELLKEQYPKHKFEFIDSGIDKSDLQDFSVIESRLRSFLQQFAYSDELLVVAGTGPTAVGMAWTTLSLTMKDKFKLYVLQRPEYTPGGKLATLKEIQPYIDEALDDKLREHHLKLSLPADIFSDEIVEHEYKKATAIAPALDINVLILGETGCGKDKMAEYIVENSPHDKSKYKPINCASLPDDLLYTELFGHVQGAFTGALKDRKGLFEECNGGTLFLDEIGDISPFMQQSLLRAIANKQIKKAGENEIRENIRVRIIAATNHDLYQKCKDGKFRWDLYYRLCDQEIELQPYRNRTVEQRQTIIRHYISKAESKWGRKIDFTQGALSVIENYSFPGNFREIDNSIHSLFGLGEEIITEDMLPRRFQDKDTEIDETYEAALRSHCLAVYKKYKNNISDTYKALGYKNSTQFKNKLIQWGQLHINS